MQQSFLLRMYKYRYGDEPQITDPDYPRYQCYVDPAKLFRKTKHFDDDAILASAKYRMTMDELRFLWTIGKVRVDRNQKYLKYQFRRKFAVIRIQRQFREAYYNPTYSLCIRRLRRQFVELNKQFQERCPGIFS